MTHFLHRTRSLLDRLRRYVTQLRERKDLVVKIGLNTASKQEAAENQAAGQRVETETYDLSPTQAAFLFF